MDLLLLAGIILCLLVLLAAPFRGFATEGQTTPMVFFSLEEEALRSAAAEVQKETPRTGSKLVLENVSYPATNNSAAKRYEPYTAITMTGSLNYQLLHGEDVIHTDEGLILVQDCYAVAMGPAFGSVGNKFLVTLEGDDGETRQIKVIMCDTKGGTSWFGGDGHILEFIVDMSKLNGTCRQWGDMNHLPAVNGYISKIERILGEEEYEIKE